MDPAEALLEMDLTSRFRKVLQESANLSEEQAEQVVDQLFQEMSGSRLAQEKFTFADNSPAAVALRLRTVMPTFYRLGVDPLFLRDVQVLVDQHKDAQ